MTQIRNDEILFTHPRHNITQELLTLLKYETTQPYNQQSSKSVKTQLKTMIQQDLSSHTMFQKNVTNVYPLLEIKYLEVIDFPVSLDFITEHLSSNSQTSNYKYVGDCFKDLCLLTHNARIFMKNNQNTDDKCVEFEDDLIKLINSFMQNFRCPEIVSTYKFAKFSSFETFQQIIFNIFPPGLIPNAFFKIGDNGQRELQSCYNTVQRPAYKEEVDEMLYFFQKIGEQPTIQTNLIASLVNRIKLDLDNDGVLQSDTITIEFQSIQPQIYWWFQDLVYKTYQCEFSDFSVQKEYIARLKKKLMPHHNQYININQQQQQKTLEQIDKAQMKLQKQAMIQVKTNLAIFDPPPMQQELYDKPLVNDLQPANNQPSSTYQTQQLQYSDQTRNISQFQEQKSIPPMQIVVPVQQQARNELQFVQPVQKSPMQKPVVSQNQYPPLQQIQPVLPVQPIQPQHLQSAQSVIPLQFIQPVQQFQVQKSFTPVSKPAKSNSMNVINNTYDDKIQEISSIHSPDDSAHAAQPQQKPKRKYTKRQNSNVSHMSDQQNSASIIHNSLLATTNTQQTFYQQQQQQIQFQQPQAIQLVKKSQLNSQQLSTNAQEQNYSFQGITPNQLENSKFASQNQILMMQQHVQQLNQEAQRTQIKQTQAPMHQMQYVQQKSEINTPLSNNTKLSVQPLQFVQPQQQPQAMQYQDQQQYQQQQMQQLQQKDIQQKQIQQQQQQQQQLQKQLRQQQQQKQQQLIQQEKFKQAQALKAQEEARQQQQLYQQQLLYEQQRQQQAQAQYMQPQPVIPPQQDFMVLQKIQTPLQQGQMLHYNVPAQFTQLQQPIQQQTKQPVNRTNMQQFPAYAPVTIQPPQYVQPAPQQPVQQYQLPPTSLPPQQMQYNYLNAQAVSINQPQVQSRAQQQRQRQTQNNVAAKPQTQQQRPQLPIKQMDSDNNLALIVPDFDQDEVDYAIFDEDNQ